MQLFWIQHESSVGKLSVEAVRREYHTQAEMICCGKLFNQGHHFTVMCPTLANIGVQIIGSSSGISPQISINTSMVARFKTRNDNKVCLDPHYIHTQILPTDTHRQYVKLS